MRSFCWMLLALPLAVSAQQSKDEKLSITGNVKGLDDQSKVFITDINNPTDTVASSPVKGGQFVLNGHVQEPGLFEINFGGAKKKAPLFIGNDKIVMTGDADDVKSLSVKGSSSNDDFMEFQTTFNPYFARLNGIMQLGSSPEGAAKKDSLRDVYKKTADSIQHEIDVFISKKKSSYVSPFVLVIINQLTEDPTLQDKRLTSLAPNVQKSYYGDYLGKQLADAKVGAIGTDAMDFTQNDTSGKAVKLSSFKGKYVLVDFWASWCGPCRMENPNVVSTYKKYKDKNFTVLGISLDKTKEPWVKAIKDDGLAWTQVSDLKFWSNEVAVKYHIQSIPQNFLIDPNGKIVGRNLRGADLQAKLAELLGSN